MQRADVDLWAGMVALAQNDAGSAALRLGAATALLGELLPPSHPKLAGARCALGLALGRSSAAAAAETRPLVESACPVHARWGMAEPLLKQWAERPE